jgi:hypothetical protein
MGTAPDNADSTGNNDSVIPVGSISPPGGCWVALNKIVGASNAGIPSHLRDCADLAFAVCDCHSQMALGFLLSYKS